MARSRLTDGGSQGVATTAGLRAATTADGAPLNDMLCKGQTRQHTASGYPDDPPSDAGVGARLPVFRLAPAQLSAAFHHLDCLGLRPDAARLLTACSWSKVRGRFLSLSGAPYVSSFGRKILPRRLTDFPENCICRACRFTRWGDAEWVLASFPHPALRATFSRREKDSERVEPAPFGLKRSASQRFAALRKKMILFDSLLRV